MALGSDLIQAMNDRDDEIDTTADATRALRALNRAQDLIEVVIAGIPRALGTHTTVSTTSGQETTAKPSGYIRVDEVQFIDPTTSRPQYALVPVQTPGQVRTQNIGRYANILYGSSGLTGKPTHYTFYGDNFYWEPVPDATHTIRVYGFGVASAITSGGTFAYDDAFIGPIASLAVRIFKQKVDDPQEDIMRLAQHELAPVLQQLDLRWRDRPNIPTYTRVRRF